MFLKGVIKDESAFSLEGIHVFKAEAIPGTEIPVVLRQKALYGFCKPWVIDPDDSEQGKYFSMKIGDGHQADSIFQQRRCFPIKTKELKISCLLLAAK